MASKCSARRRLARAAGQGTAPAAQDTLPALAGDDANLAGLAVRPHWARLPPLIVRGVDDVQNVTKAEVQPLAGEATVFGLVVVEEGSGDRSRTASAKEGRGGQPSPAPLPPGGPPPAPSRGAPRSTEVVAQEHLPASAEDRVMPLPHCSRHRSSRAALPWAKEAGPLAAHLLPGAVAALLGAALGSPGRGRLRAEGIRPPACPAPAQLPLGSLPLFSSASLFLRVGTTHPGTSIAGANSSQGNSSAMRWAPLASPLQLCRAGQSPLDTTHIYPLPGLSPNEPHTARPGLCQENHKNFRPTLKASMSQPQAQVGLHPASTELACPAHPCP